MTCGGPIRKYHRSRCAPILALSVGLLLSSVSRADCVSPAGVTGQFQYIASDFKFCDGSTWQSMTVSNTGTSCATPGVLTKSGSDLRFCNGTNWISASGSTASTGAGVAGTIAWKSANSRLEWFNGTDWKVVGNSSSVDPCGGKTIGEACSGTTALYAGAFDGGSYMVMPSGCANSTSNPSCSGGADTVTKTWNDGSSNYYDIPGVANVSGFATQSSQRGDVTTPIIAAITDSAKGGLHAAARYCDQMVYGGYDDWYLPSKSELVYLYCKSSPSAHNSSYPLENVNCGGAGPSYQLTGFGTGGYWSSTEEAAGTAWAKYFVNGNTTLSNKIGWTRVRCIRRYAADITPDAIDWPDFSTLSDSRTLRGIGGAVDLQLSAMNVVGTPTLSFRVNGGSWTTFTTSSPRTVPMKLNDTLEFQVGGTYSDAALITIKNQSDGGTVLDTVLGTYVDSD